MKFINIDKHIFAFIERDIGIHSWVGNEWQFLLMSSIEHMKQQRA